MKDAECTRCCYAVKHCVVYGIIIYRTLGCDVNVDADAGCDATGARFSFSLPDPHLSGPCLPASPNYLNPSNTPRSRMATAVAPDQQQLTLARQRPGSGAGAGTLSRAARQTVPAFLQKLYECVLLTPTVWKVGADCDCDEGW